MKRFLIEVPHGADKQACDRAIRVFHETGSHFLTHAEWGCTDGEHKAWIIVDTESKEEAKFIVPPIYRHDAKIVELVHFNAPDMMETEKFHHA
jgi:hypothetical protein